MKKAIILILLTIVLNSKFIICSEANTPSQSPTPSISRTPTPSKDQIEKENKDAVIFNFNETQDYNEVGKLWFDKYIKGKISNDHLQDLINCMNEAPLMYFMINDSEINAKIANEWFKLSFLDASIRNYIREALSVLDHSEDLLFSYQKADFYKKIVKMHIPGNVAIFTVM